MNIVIVTWDYPDNKRSVFPFVKNLVVEWARQGHACTVIAPYSITKNKKYHKYELIEDDNNSKVTVLRPNYLSFSTIRLFGIGLSSFFHKRAVNYALKSLEFKPDVIYCHFWHSAVESYEFANIHKIPIIVATGESTIDKVSIDDTAVLRNTVKGVVSVSSYNRDVSISMGLTSLEKVEVFPNAIDSNLFRRLDKKACRTKLGIPQDVFIVIFVGWFSERKGSLRLSDALNRIKGESVYSIFVGSGDQEPDCPNILFKGLLKHHAIPDYLNASDVFVLPTFNEGCCNAVVEAMACGLPVVSADLPFNKDICNDTNSILIDPRNIEQIKSAIISLRDNVELRQRLSKGALLSASELTIDRRANKIIKYIESKI